MYVSLVIGACQTLDRLRVGPSCYVTDHAVMTDVAVGAHRGGSAEDWRELRHANDRYALR